MSLLFSVFKWNKKEKAVERRGVGDMKAKNGAGGGITYGLLKTHFYPFIYHFMQTTIP